MMRLSLVLVDGIEHTLTPTRLTKGPLTLVPCDLLFLQASVQGAVGVAPLNNFPDFSPSTY